MRVLPLLCRTVFIRLDIPAVIARLYSSPVWVQTLNGHSNWLECGTDFNNAWIVIRIGSITSLVRRSGIPCFKVGGVCVCACVRTCVCVCVCVRGVGRRKMSYRFSSWSNSVVYRPARQSLLLSGYQWLQSTLASPPLWSHNTQLVTQHSALVTQHLTDQLVTQYATCVTQHSA